MHLPYQIITAQTSRPLPPSQATRATILQITQEDQAFLLSSLSSVQASQASPPSQATRAIT